MGCDIHAVFQAKKNGAWKDVPSKWEQDRHYFLFSWLADVRNGFGFAGVPTYTPVKPISQPRGMPEDFTVEDDEHPTTLEALGHRAKWCDDKKHPTLYMGDHSHSWLTADEILSAPVPGRVWRTGVVDRSFFDSWDGHTPPEEWSGGISGGGVVVAVDPMHVDSTTTHVQICWLQDEEETLAYFTNEVRRLKNEHGELRLVFGFDS